MKIELELWHLVTLLLAFFSCVWTFGVVLLGQIEKRLDERFKAQEETHKKSQQHWDQKFAAMEASAKEWVRLEHDFLDFKAALPMMFVIREDFVRNQTVIEAKLDALYNKLEVVQMKGANNG